MNSDENKIGLKSTAKSAPNASDLNAGDLAAEATQLSPFLTTQTALSLKNSVRNNDRAVQTTITEYQGTVSRLMTQIGVDGDSTKIISKAFRNAGRELRDAMAPAYSGVNDFSRGARKGALDQSAISDLGPTFESTEAAVDSVFNRLNGTMTEVLGDYAGNREAAATFLGPPPKAPTSLTDDLGTALAGGKIDNMAALSNANIDRLL